MLTFYRPLHAPFCAADENALDLLERLLRLEDSFALPQFAVRRQAAVVTLAEAWPASVATFLGQQVWDRNYTLGRRLDILAMISDAARVLSAPLPTPSVATKDAVRLFPTACKVGKDIGAHPIRGCWPHLCRSIANHDARGAQAAARAQSLANRDVDRDRCTGRSAHAPVHQPRGAASHRGGHDQPARQLPAGFR